jgi:hypothetical protein
VAGLVQQQTVALQSLSRTCLLEGVTLCKILILHFFTISAQVLLSNSQRVLFLLLKKRSVLIGGIYLCRLLFYKSACEIVCAVSIRLRLRLFLKIKNYFQGS